MTSDIYRYCMFMLYLDRRKEEMDSVLRELQLILLGFRQDFDGTLSKCIPVPSSLKSW